jgi:hypothetical protein
LRCTIFQAKRLNERSHECLMFGSWLAMVRLAGRVVPLLPRWFQRVDPAASH